jgi:acetyl-CoA acetyltransferase
MTPTDTAAVIGGGTTAAFGKFPDRTVTDLAAEALANALDDAGLARDELDGLVSNLGEPLTHNYDRLTEALGLDVDFVGQFWSHGRFAGSALQYAAMAVQAGLAEYVAVGVGLQFSALGQYGGETNVSLAEGGSVSEHAERPWYGMTAPAGANALATRYYMERYGATGADLAHVGVTFRYNAGLDPRSHFSDPIDVADHQASPYVVEPLRRLDCAPLSDGGAYVIVTSAANAETADDPAFVAAMRGLPAGPENPLFARPGMGIRTHSEYDYDARVTDPLYADAGLGREDIDALYVYDGFTSNIWFALERFGFCAPGEAFRYVRDTGIGLDSPLPVNTHGGLHSNGHISAWNHVVEMYDQLRGRAGKRQLDDPRAVQYVTPIGDAVILRGGE